MPVQFGLLSQLSPPENAQVLDFWFASKLFLLLMSLLVPCSYNAPSQVSLLLGVWMPLCRDLKLIFEHPLLQPGKEIDYSKLFINRIKCLYYWYFFLVFLKYLIIIKKRFNLTNQTACFKT